MELWRAIPGFEGLYIVSNLGRVQTVSHTVIRSNGWPYHSKCKLLKNRLRGKTNRKPGYYCVRLYKDELGKSYSIHRLVAAAFIPNAKNMGIVNHIDGNTFNNHVDNLEWCTVQENTTHANLQLKSFDKFKMPVDIYTSWGCLVYEAASIKEAATAIKGHRCAIRKVIDGKQPYHMGYFFKLKAA